MAEFHFERDYTVRGCDMRPRTIARSGERLTEPELADRFVVAFRDSLRRCTPDARVAEVVHDPTERETAVVVPPETKDA